MYDIFVGMHTVFVALHGLLLLHAEEQQCVQRRRSGRTSSRIIAVASVVASLRQ